MKVSPVAIFITTYLYELDIRGWWPSSECDSRAYFPHISEKSHQSFLSAFSSLVVAVIPVNLGYNSRSALAIPLETHQLTYHFEVVHL